MNKPKKPRLKLYSDQPSTVNKTGSWRSMRPIVDTNECIKCGKCWSVCPEGCIHKNKGGYFIADLDYCKGCGICANECPKKCIKMVEEVR